MGSYNGVIQWSHIVDAGVPDGKLSLRKGRRTSKLHATPRRAQSTPADCKHSVTENPRAIAPKTVI